MAKRDLPSPEVLRQLLRYEPETGKLFWLSRGPEHFTGTYWTPEEQSRRFNTRYAGKEAFTATDARGYGVGAVFDVLCSAHRACWAIAYGEWPALQVDHINGDRRDNRLLNLRLVTNRENSLNSAMKKSNTVGLAGVSFHRDRYRSQIKINGRQKFLGYFDTAEAAHNAYCAAKAAEGFSDRHGKPKRQPLPSGPRPAHDGT